MRKFTKFTLTLALLFGVLGGANSVKAKTLDVDLSKLPASSENTTWSWDAGTSTGTFAWSAASYNSTQLFGSGNYSVYTTLKLETASKGANHFRIIIKYSNGATQTTINPVATGNTNINLTDYATLENLANVESIRLSGAGDGTGDITVSRIYLEGPDIVYIEALENFEAPAGTTDLNGMTGEGSIKWSVDYPKEMGTGTGWLGDIDSDEKSVDISTYDYLHFVISSVSANANLGVRVFVSDGSTRKCLYPHPIAEAANVTNWEAFSPITSTGTYVVNISKYPLLRGFKGGNSWDDGNAGTVVISQSYLCSGAPVSYKETGKYTLFGEATGSVSLTAALADASATFYDATGVVGTGVDLTSVANKNALFKANAGVLANTKNVIVGSTCANLVLTDGNYPFKAPAAFTATNAKFTKTVTAAGYATMVIPFAVATLPEGVEAYNLTGVTGESITYSTAATIAADKPVLIKATEGTYNFEASGVAVAATADGVVTNGLLNGGYATMTAAAGANNYVLQKNVDDVNFYLVKGTDATVKPFRAYLTAPATARELTLNFGETTGISAALMNSDERIVKSEVYNLNGQRVAAPQKGLYIVNGKKVIVK